MSAVLQTRDAPTLTMRAAFQPQSIDEKSRSVAVVWSTGSEVTRYDYYEDRRYLEVLSMDPAHVRLERLNGGAPLLDSHGIYRLSNVLGVVEAGSARVDGTTGTARVRFSKRADVEPIWQDVRSGILRNISVGYVVRKWDVKRANGDQPETRTAIEWEPYEVSLVPVPADAGAQIRSEPQEGPVSERESLDVQKHERERCSEIMAFCRTQGIDAARAEAWIAEGTTPAAVRAAFLDGLQEHQRATHISTHSSSGTGRDQHMRRDAANALARRAGVPVEGDGHRHFGDARLLDIARVVLESGGVNTRSLSGHQLATRALATSDFTEVLAYAGDKIVRRSYDSVPLAHRDVFRRSLATDFRAKHSVSNASAALLPEVPEGGIYERHTVSAERASYALKTFGAIIPITRQLLVNDDFGMVESAARQRGRSAAETERKVVWDFILSNPNAPDGSPMFQESRGNFPAASATPITAGTLAAARQALRTMVSPDGFAINALLKHVVVAPGGEVEFDQLLNGQYVPVAAGTAMTPSLRNVVLHVEPLISSDKKHWFGFTDVGQCDQFEYAYLSGSEGPRVESRTNFETDAFELKVSLDFGIGAIDFRGAVYQRET